jgi:pyrroline-5-carboxylate reductase
MVFGIIGLGTMGAALAGALRARGDARVIGTTRRSATGRAAAEKLGIELAANNLALARESDVVVLRVKPHQARHVVEEIASGLGGKLLITICAAVTIAEVRAWSADRASVVRAMPNTPCLIGAGMTVLSADASTSAKDLEAASQLFSTLGRTAVLDEELMDGVTGLSGCGPAYVFLIIEALSEAGVKLGIDRATSTLLVAQTLLGAAQLVLQRGVHPAALKDEVTTPAGCTIDGLTALEDGRLRSTLISGVVAAANRSRALRDELPAR